MNLLIDFLITNFTLCPSIITYSIVGNDPMLLPQANTQSYYENSKCSPMCPVEFLYWCWGAYLEFDCERYRKIHSQDIDFKSFDSYNIALSQCKWMGTKCPANMNRLISPQVDLPPNLFSTNAPAIIITSSTADPLRDDARDLVQKLQEKNGGKMPANVSHFELTGSHAISLMFDNKNTERFLKKWHGVMWK